MAPAGALIRNAIGAPRVARCMNRDELTAWIADLRGRLEREELDRRPTISAQASSLVLLVDSQRSAGRKSGASLRSRGNKRDIAE
jgi:hypothetical protein